jgi:hypothetical protein
LASPFLEQFFASSGLHVLAQPAALTSVVELEQAAALDEALAQQAFAGVSVELTFSVLALSAEVTFCADAVFTVKAKIKANNEITSATFFIDIIY